MLTLPYSPIIVSAECLSDRAPGSLLEADLGGKRHADSHLRLHEAWLRAFLLTLDHARLAIAI